MFYENLSTTTEGQNFISGSAVTFRALNMWNVSQVQCEASLLVGRNMTQSSYTSQLCVTFENRFLQPCLLCLSCFTWAAPFFLLKLP